MILRRLKRRLFRLVSRPDFEIRPLVSAPTDADRERLEARMRGDLRQTQTSTSTPPTDLDPSIYQT